MNNDSWIKRTNCVHELFFISPKRSLVLEWWNGIRMRDEPQSTFENLVYLFHQLRVKYVPYPYKRHACMLLSAQRQTFQYGTLFCLCETIKLCLECNFCWVHPSLAKIYSFPNSFVCVFHYNASSIINDFKGNWNRISIYDKSDNCQSY